jgi:hypothetical protein
MPGEHETMDYGQKYERISCEFGGDKVALDRR